MEKEILTFKEWKIYREESKESKNFSNPKFQILDSICKKYVAKVKNGHNADLQSRLMFQEISEKFDVKNELYENDTRSPLTDVQLAKINARYGSPVNVIQGSLWG